MMCNWCWFALGACCGAVFATLIVTAANLIDARTNDRKMDELERENAYLKETLWQMLE